MRAPWEIPCKIRSWLQTQLALIGLAFKSIQYHPNEWTPPCCLNPPIIPAEKRLRAKVYKWLLWGLIWRSLTPLITMTLNPLVWELIWKLIFIHFLMQLLSTFEHAHRTFAPKKIIPNKRWGNYRMKVVNNTLIEKNSKM